jgi:hypothetical protein
MNAVHNFRQAEFREKVTQAILEVLAQLPEAQRDIFIRNHYYGCSLKEIAGILGCGPSEVETTLGLINSILYQRTRALLTGDPQLDTETSLSASGTSQEAKCCYPFASSIKPSWVSHAQI